MADHDPLYLGLRGPQLGSGHGGPTVVGIRTGQKHRTLFRHPDAPALLDTFEWGYRGAGPRALAEAILADRAGSNPAPELVDAFLVDVVSRLGHEFELSGPDIDA